MFIKIRENQKVHVSSKGVRSLTNQTSAVTVNMGMEGAMGFGFDRGCLAGESTSQQAHFLIRVRESRESLVA